MQPNEYVQTHRNELFRIFGEIYSGRIIERYIDTNISEEDFEKSCCKDAVLTHKYNKGIVDFPISAFLDSEKTVKMSVSSEDDSISLELYTIIMCEQMVKEGRLKKKGDKYSPKETA